MDLSDLADSERRGVAEAVLDAALDAIIVIDSSGSVIEWNPAATELFLWEREEAVGRPLADLIVPDEMRVAHRRGLAHYMATGEGPALNTRLTLPGVRRDGSRLTVELTISPSESPAGPLFTGWLRDITELVEAREAVDRSEQRLASLVANISDVITVMGADGTWISTSGAGTRLMGYEEGFDPDGGILSLVHPDDVPLAERAFAEVIAGTRSSTQPIDLRVRALDGTWRVLETVAENLVDDPAVNGLVLTSRDVTQQRSRATELRRMAKQLSSLASSLTDGILLVDHEQHIVFTNQAFCAMFGLDPPAEELADLPATTIRTIAEALVKDSEEFAHGIENRLEQGRPVFGDEVPLKDGRILERDYTPIDIEGEGRGHLWLYRDISERKALDRAHKRVLDVERGLRQQAEEQARTLKEMSDLKSELVAMVSHELRTPLTSIVSFSDLLLSDLDGEPTTEVDPIGTDVQEFVTVIARNAKRLVHLVDDLLLLGQLESGIVSVDKAQTSVPNIVDRAVAAATHRALGAGIELRSHVEPGPPGFADAQRIDQVLENLLSNGLKFTDSGGTVEIDAHHDGGAWVISVADDGVGIPADEQEQLFESFFRASTTAKTTQGTGLGLAISRSIVELHGGTIVVESAPGHGSTFRFTIPDRSAP